jgi:hypothetical protein
MDEKAFDSTHALIEAGGLTVNESRYDGQCFGSWYVIVGSMPRRRVVWGGRERSLRIEQETDRLLAGLIVWDELAIADDPKNQTPEWIVGRLQEHRH